MTVGEGWKIRKDRKHCEKPGCPLPTAKEFFALLEWPSCERHDLCEACFAQLPQSGPERPIYWRARRREDSKKTPVLDLPSLRLLFDRLGELESDGPAGGGGGEVTEEQHEEALERAAGLRFFVTLMLVRKRVLRLVDATTPEQERADLVVVDTKVEGMEPVLLFAPTLDEERLEGLKDELLGALDQMGSSDPA